ncbi:HlyD family efflux transporter periplasmic adaptor subunit [Lachnospiraceae bacterium MD1]|uniref:HlyD family efflux transporter periplasmic adaptor subunit n=1 Tax=Variimorphobacter saccharofermentans TaxID=2755051 RepID=A0A839K634_9FIRM|nr:HlyD family efflux transporter periplasmic adaptor subunit [Variimorphobacter saccharofermentans]MBB2184642.1 HlyD family efflux transporter periplasmic adaptor subunit [Variimorphobacter saccharofermentans]
MKPILININEISDSRERFESKPNFFLVIFNYAVLGIMVVSLIWMYFGKIDIVVKSEGLIRPNSQVATVVNTYGGTLEEVYIKDGSIVKKGDTLYVIEHEDLLTELDYYNEQLADTDNTLVMLNKYKKSIEDEFNYFTEVPDEEEYFVKVKSYLMNCKLSENEVDYNVKEREMSLDTVTDQLVKLSGEFNNTKKLKSAIISNKNLFTTSSEELEYYHKYLKYQSDYEILNQKYLSAKAEINKSTAEEGLVNSQKYYNNALMGLKILKSSIENGKNQFDAESSYSLQYEEYINKIADLTTTYEQAKETYEVNKALEGLAVSEWDVQQSKNALEEAERAVDTYKISFMNNITSNITEMEKNIEEITLNKKNTMSKEKLLKQNENDRISALDNFKLQYIVELDNAINTLKDNIAGLEANKQSLELQGEKTVFDDNGVEVNIAQYRNNELAATINNINTYRNKKRELEASIIKINSQIDSAIVKASRSGSVNSYIELVEGDTLQGGVEVLSIIPENDSDYKVNIYVGNEDIGKLKNDMKVKFNVYAFPNSEYGYLTGTITSISNDLKVDQSSGSAYYLVEAILDKNKLYNSKGQKANLKAGMACQAQMITENKRILIYLLEKIDLWMDK